MKIKNCKWCGRKDELHGHHKIPVAERPDLRAVESNIEILCSECHAKEHPRIERLITHKRGGKILRCTVCSKEYYVKKSKAEKSKYCSRVCYLSNQKRGNEIPCMICGKIFYRHKSVIKTHNYCSNKCRYIGTWKVRKGEL